MEIVHFEEGKTDLSLFEKVGYYILDKIADVITFPFELAFYFAAVAISIPIYLATEPSYIIMHSFELLGENWSFLGHLVVIFVYGIALRVLLGAPNFGNPFEKLRLNRMEILEERSSGDK